MKILQMMKLHFSTVVRFSSIGHILGNFLLYVQFTRYIQKTSGVWTYFGQLGAICPNPKLKYFRQKIGQKNHFFYYYVQKAVDSTLFFNFLDNSWTFYTHMSKKNIILHVQNIIKWTIIFTGKIKKETSRMMFLQLIFQQLL